MSNSIPLILTILAIISIWHLSVELGIFNSTIFPYPFDIVLALWQTIANFELFENLLASLIRVLIGLLIGTILGVLFALVTANYKFIYDSFGNIINFLRNIPIIAYVPLAIVWFGIGEQSKFFLISLGVFFPVWVNSYTGFIRVDEDLIRAAKVYGADKLDLLKVKFHSSIPFILAGIRIGIAYAFITLVAAEMSGSIKGLGLMIENYRLFLRIDLMIAYMLVIGALGYLSDKLLLKASEKFFPYAKIGDSQ